MAENRAIGSMTKIVNTATVAVIESGDERITPELLEAAGNRPLRDFRAQDL